MPDEWDDKAVTRSGADNLLVLLVWCAVFASSGCAIERVGYHRGSRCCHALSQQGDLRFNAVQLCLLGMEGHERGRVLTV